MLADFLLAAKVVLNVDGIVMSKLESPLCTCIALGLFKTNIDSIELMSSISFWSIVKILSPSFNPMLFAISFTCKP